MLNPYCWLSWPFSPVPELLWPWLPRLSRWRQGRWCAWLRALCLTRALLSWYYLQCTRQWRQANEMKGVR